MRAGLVLFLVACAGAPAAPPAPRPLAQGPSLPWAAGLPPMVEATSTDAPLDDGGEVSLLPFAFDPAPIEAFRYDRCVAAGVCNERRVTGPPGAPAVGMRWGDALGFCRTRGLEVQSPHHDHCIRSSVGEDAYALRDVIDGVDPREIVTAGFRCVDVHRSRRLTHGTR